MKQKSNKYYDELMLNFIKNKDKKTFYQIVEDWKGILINFFYNSNNNLETSEELTQDVFITIWKIEKYQAQGTFSSWIIKISKNKLIDRLRKKKISTYSYDESPHLAEFGNKYSLEDKIINDDESSHVREIINNLPEDQKIILTLSHIQDMPYQEIADIMNCSINSIKGKIFRAINKFKELSRYV